MTIYWFTGDLYELGGEVQPAAAIYVGSKGQRLPKSPNSISSAVLTVFNISVSPVQGVARQK